MENFEEDKDVPRIELYELDDVYNGNFYRNSKYVHLIALLPHSEDGELEVVENGLMIKGQGFNKRRALINELMPGCDMYYRIDNVPQTADVRTKLKNSVVTLKELPNGRYVIDERKYFVVKSLFEGLSSSQKRKLKEAGIDPKKIYITDEPRSLSFVMPTKEHKAGYMLSVTDINRIRAKGLEDIILSEDNLETFVQNGLSFTSITLDEALSSTITYYPGDTFKKAKGYSEGEKIQVFYKYNPIEEEPHFGNTYELEKSHVTEDGKVVWKKTPKIVQNEHDVEYAMRVLEKSVIPVVEIPAHRNAKIYEELAKQGKLDKLIEFTAYQDEFCKKGFEYLVDAPKEKSVNDESKFHM